MQPLFRAFNPYAPLRVYHRNLPHWRQEGCTYFTTFRLADSIPRQVILRWIEDDRIWLRAHGIDGPLSDAENRQKYDLLPEESRRKFERQRGHRLHIELDKCHGMCRLSDPAARTILESAMAFFDGKRLHSGDYAIMPNHVHWLVASLPGFELEDLLQSVKRFSSTQLGRELRLEGRIWQSENYDHIVRDRVELAAFRQYIERNPPKANLQQNSFSYRRVTWLDRP